MGGNGCYSDDSAEKIYREEVRRGAAARRELLRQGLAMKDTEYFLADAEARVDFLGEVELFGLDQCPWEIGIHVTVTGYKEKKGLLVVRTKAVWLLGSRGSMASPVLGSFALGALDSRTTHQRQTATKKAMGPT